MPSIRFIAETAFSHEGDSNYLESLVDELLNSKVEIIKFQVLIEPEYMPDHPMAEKCHDLMLSKKNWLQLIERVRSSGKKVLILPVDIGALEWIISEDLADILEIHSVNLFRRDFFEYFKAKSPQCELILSISGYDLEFLDYIVNKYKDLNLPRLSLMFGFQSFPTKPENLALGRISFLHNRYGLEVGYADHSAWNEDSSSLLSASIALGTNTIEKHVVLDAGAERIDFSSAVDTSMLDDLIEDAKIVASAIGDSKKYFLNDTEHDYGNRRLRLISTDEVATGERLAPPKAGYFWSTERSGKYPTHLFEFFGIKAASDISKDKVIA